MAAFDCKPLIVIQNPAVATAKRTIPILTSENIGLAANTRVGVSIEVPAGMTVATLATSICSNTSDAGSVFETLPAMALAPGAGPVRKSAAMDVIEGGAMKFVISAPTGSPTTPGETVRVYVHRETRV